MWRWDTCQPLWALLAQASPQCIANVALQMQMLTPKLRQCTQSWGSCWPLLWVLLATVIRYVSVLLDPFITIELHPWH